MNQDGSLWKVLSQSSENPLILFYGCVPRIETAHIVMVLASILTRLKCGLDPGPAGFRWWW